MLQFNGRDLIKIVVFFCLEIVVPYFCFYSGSVLIGQVREALTKQTTTKAALVGEYCSAMSDKVFLARKSLIEKTM